jgi:glycosyltransferase involved in cell wall biosynthesis
MTQSTFVIVTAYNEAASLGATLDALARAFPGAPVWVADDGSGDATSEIARQRGATVVRSERVIGKGAAATLAAREVLERLASGAEGSGEPGGRGSDPGVTTRAQGEVVVLLCDGDLGDSAGSLGPLVEAVRSGQADLAVAAFAHRVGGGVGLAVGFARWAIRRRCGLELGAPISGQRALSMAALRDAVPFAAGFGMEIGMTIDMARAGHRVAEIELDLSHRATGRTLAGFVHRGMQLLDFVRVYRARR